MTAVYSMAEDHPVPNAIHNPLEELDKSKEGDEELDRSKEGDSDELSGSFSDGDGYNGHRNGSDDDHKQPKRRRQRRLKGGRRHHRKYRPYNLLSSGERKILDDKDKARASLKREDLFASGHPAAPYNTTQFLIDDHIKSKISPDLSYEPSPVPPTPRSEYVTEEPPEMPPGKQADEAGDACPAIAIEFQDSPLTSAVATPRSDGDRYDREFVAAYENVNQDRLYCMSRDDLIRTAAILEMKVETMERALRREKRQRSATTVGVRVVNVSKDEISDANSLGSSNEEFGEVDVNNVHNGDADEC